jgi:hypothetical protein
MHVKISAVVPGMHGMRIKGVLPALYIKIIKSGVRLPKRKLGHGGMVASEDSAVVS